MQTRTILAVAVLTAFCCQHCSYSLTEQHATTVIRNPRIVDEQVTFQAHQVTFVQGALSVVLDRTCQRVREHDVVHLERANRVYDTEMGWIGVASVALTGFGAAGTMAAMNDDCFFDDQDCQRDDTAAWTVAGVTLGVSLIASAILLHYTVGEHVVETVKSQVTERVVEDGVCPTQWPHGDADLVTPNGARYPGQAFAEGRVDFPIAQAAADLWSPGAVLQLRLPGVRDWVPLELPDTVRRAIAEHSGQATLALDIGFDDARGNNDGTLDANENAEINFTLTNQGQSTARDIMLHLSLDDDASVDLETPLRIASLAPGESVQGRAAIAARADLPSGTLALDADVHIGGVPAQNKRLRLAVRQAPQAERAFVVVEPNPSLQTTLEAGATRVQSVLTATRRYRFVAEQETRQRIQSLVDDGGGSLDERRRRAIDAAREENIGKVFVLSGQTLKNKDVHFVLSVHNTLNGDRIFMHDHLVTLDRWEDALSAFDALAARFAAWENP